MIEFPRGMCMWIYSKVAHVQYHFKSSIACVQQSNIVAVVPLAIPLRLYNSKDLNRSFFDAAPHLI